MKKTRIGVVRGGPSSEYDISLKTGAAVLDALDREKYEPLDIVIDKEGTWHIHGLEVAPHDAIRKVDAIFNALHGYYGEDGKIQQLFEAHGIPFTGSGSFGAAVSGVNKHLSKKLFSQAGLKTPQYVLIEREGDDEIDATQAYLLVHSKFSLPYVVKPGNGGSSIGTSVVKKREEFAEALAKAFEKGDIALVEEFIEGVEATVGVIENFRGKDMYALPPIEIRPRGDFFDHESKYGTQADASLEGAFGARRAREGARLEHEPTRTLKENVSAGVPRDPVEIVPATFSPSIKAELERLAAAAHSALGLRHYSRSDFIVTPRRGIYILETNALPGLTEESLVPKALAAVGSSLPEFIGHLVGLALG